MPIIGWTQADVLSQRVVEAGPQAAVLASYDGPKASGSGKSINLFLTFRLTKGECAGKEIKYALSNGTSDVSQLGNLQWAPMGQMSVIHAAINKIPANQIVAGSTELDELIDRPLTLILGVNIVDGIPRNTINGFQPADAATAAVPF